MSRDLSYCRQIFDHYQTIFNDEKKSFLNPNALILLPELPARTLRKLITDATDIFKHEDTLLQIEPPAVVVGDLHGHLPDLLQILARYQTPLNKKYIFLGDLCDRGQFSLEVMELVLAMKVLWPKNVFVIRGNHEFAEICEENGFSNDIMKAYNNRFILTAFETCFSYIPLAARMGKLFFVHGGIGPSIGKCTDISIIPRPIRSFSLNIVEEMLWSDPNPVDKCQYFLPSIRGSGYLFSKSALEAFLNDNELSCIIRGHQMVRRGIERLFDGKVITVFSASNYCGNNTNKAGVLEISFDGKTKDYILEQCKYRLRSTATFYTLEPENKLRRFDSKPQNRLPSLPKQRLFIPNACNKKLDRKRKSNSLVLRSDIIPQMSQ